MDRARPGRPTSKALTRRRWATSRWPSSVRELTTSSSGCRTASRGGLYCADETDGESLRVCEQIFEALYAYEVGGTAAIPSLAEECVPNDTLDEWTCTLRSGVKFHDGATLDANDVVQSYAVQWDVENPLHVGRTSTFDYFSALWGGFLNPPLPPAE